MIEIYEKEQKTSPAAYGPRRRTYTLLLFYVLLCTYGLLFCIYYYYYCCTVCTALLFSYSAIFIAASVRNKLIHSLIAVEALISETCYVCLA